MGLNSYNRFSNILPSSVKEEYTREVIKDNSSVVDESYFDNISICSDCSNILESLILIKENIRDMGERYTELVISNMVNESIIPNYTNQPECIKERYNLICEVKKDLENVLIVAKESVRQAAARFVSIAGSIIEQDKPSYKKYVKAIEENSLEGFYGIKNFLFPDNYLDEAMGELSVYNSLSILRELRNINENVSYDNKYHFSPVEFIKENFDFDEIWFPNSVEISLMKGFADDGKSAINKSIITATECTISNIDNMKEEIFKILDEYKYTKSDIVNATILLNTVCMEYVEPMLMKFNTFLDVEGMEIAAYRRAIITTGRYALGINESEDIEQVIGDSSDAYIFDMFNN